MPRSETKVIDIEELLQLSNLPANLKLQAEALLYNGLPDSQYEKLHEAFLKNLKSNPLTRHLKNDRLDKIITELDNLSLEVSPEEDSELEIKPQKGDDVAVVPHDLVDQKSSPPPKPSQDTVERIKRLNDLQKQAAVRIAQKNQQIMGMLVYQAKAAGLANPEKLLNNARLQENIYSLLVTFGDTITSEQIVRELVNSRDFGLRQVVSLAKKQAGGEKELVSAVEKLNIEELNQDKVIRYAHDAVHDQQAQAELERVVYGQRQIAEEATRLATSKPVEAAKIFEKLTLHAKGNQPRIDLIKRSANIIREGRIKDPASFIKAFVPSGSSFQHQLIADGFDRATAGLIEMEVEKLALISNQPITHEDIQNIAARHHSATQAHAPSRTPLPAITHEAVEFGQAFHQYTQMVPPINPSAIPEDLTPHIHYLQLSGIEVEGLSRITVFHQSMVMAYHHANTSEKQYVATNSNINAASLINAFADPGFAQHLRLLEQSLGVLPEHENSFMEFWRILTGSPLPGESINPFYLALDSTTLPQPSVNTLSSFRTFLSSPGQSLRYLFGGGGEGGSFFSRLGSTFNTIANNVSLKLPNLAHSLGGLASKLKILGSGMKGLVGRGAGAALGKLGALAMAHPYILAAIGIAVMGTAYLAVSIVIGYMVWRHFRSMKIESSQNMALDQYGIVVNTGQAAEGERGEEWKRAGPNDFFTYIKDLGQVARRKLEEAPDYNGPVLYVDVSGVCWPAIGLYTQKSSAEHATTPGCTAIDIAGSDGDEIIAPYGGHVVSAEWGGENYGNLVVVEATVPLTGGGTATVTMKFAHLKKFGVSAGADIDPGAIVGEMNDTGNSSGPHLHFEVCGAHVYDVLPDPNFSNAKTRKYRIDDYCLPGTILK